MSYQREDKAIWNVPQWALDPVDTTARSAVEGAPLADNDNRLGNWMQTFTGRKFWPMDPRADEIDIRDIAHSLSMQCRYAGHCLRFYSVAEHSVLIARWLKQEGYSAEIQLAGLMHDAPETYLVDVPRPVKPFLGGYREAEQRVWEAVAERFDLAADLPGAVHRADSRILGDERAQNMTSTNDDWGLGEPLDVTLKCWSPDEAEREFLAVFNELYGED